MFRPVLLTILLCTCAPLAAAQAQLDDLYDFSNFGAVTQAPRNHVTLKSRFHGEHLVIEASILPNWHLYSITQPYGATIRGTFEIEQPELQLLEIRPVAAPRINNSPYFDVHLEEHDDSATWILTFQETLPIGETIKGRFNGQICDDESGMCILVNVSFEAVFDPDLDVTPLKTQAESVADQFVIRVNEVTASPTATQRIFDVQETVNVGNFWIAVAFAFLGGIILNFMPCVLPIIGLKILSFFEQAGKNRTRALMLNVCYSLGILSVFLFLAFLSLGLSILFTFDLFNIIMACVIFVMALSLMDVWMLNVPGALGGRTSDKLTNQEGAPGAFFKGIITTLLAIPCGAPLLSPAVNWADMQIRAGNMPEVFQMYSIIGLGMASPYLLLGAFPEWLRFLPKPGEWMETFKKIMGFCLLLAVIWILYFVQMEKLLPTVALLFALWFVCWFFGHQQLSGGVTKRSYGISAVVLGLVVLFSYQIPGVPNSYTLESAMRTRLYGHEGEHWKPYSAAAFESALSSGRTVIVDFTADWCVNCKFLEATVLRSEPILSLLDEGGIISFMADCTREGEATELLRQLGAEQVPVLAVFDPADPTKPRVLRGFYTSRDILKMLQ